MYTQMEICWILIGCKAATELMFFREILEDTGHRLGDEAFDVYNSKMLNLLVQNKI